VAKTLEADVIQYEVEDYVAHIWLNRPHKRNCVSAQLMQELGDAVRRADADPDVRVMVLRGRGNTFCSGYDLDELQDDYLKRSTSIEVASLGDSHIVRVATKSAMPASGRMKPAGEVAAASVPTTRSPIQAGEPRNIRIAKAS